jgi:hypothetical protein
MNISKKAAVLLAGLGLLGGAVGTMALQTHAQTATTDTTAVADSTKPIGHAPIGGDGNITAINGTSITMAEEANEGGASYTVDASKATVTNNGATASFSDLKVGDKIFVQGTTSGTNVVATSVSLGHPGGGFGHGRPNDNDADDTRATITPAQ